MFDLMGLPAELRIRIYEFALVRDVIRIVHNVRSVTRLSGTGNVVGNEISSSYGIQPSRFPPVLNLFLTSRKVYSESWPIFYQQNAFAFTTPHYTSLSAQDCLRFLYDRPYHALRHIRELHLLIGSYPQLQLQFDPALRLWQCVLDEISRYMSVRVLVLYIRGRTDEAGIYSCQMPNLPWKEWLCKITGLQELHMDIIGQSTDEQNIAVVQQMRSKMVVSGEQMGTEGFVIGNRSVPALAWTMTSPCNSLLTSLKYPDLEQSFGS